MTIRYTEKSEKVQIKKKNCRITSDKKFLTFMMTTSLKYIFIPSNAIQKAPKKKTKKNKLDQIVNNFLQLVANMGLETLQTETKFARQNSNCNFFPAI